ncbi:box C/D snoRNA protein 1-like, partial [Argonauta hians]
IKVMSDASEVVKCGVCHAAPFKYRCPGCALQTCCVACVKQHKTDSGCTGVRNKTAFVAIEHFNDLNLLSDYRLLENAARVADNCRREPLLKRSKSRSLLWLSKEAYKRHIHLKSLPYNMQRRKHNSSIFNFKTKQIQWDISWIFPQTGVSLTEHRTCETLTVMEAYQSLFSTGKAASFLVHKLKRYRQADPTNLEFLMKAEMYRAKGKHYYSLDATKSFVENLRGKTLLEHPRILVVFAEEKHSYLDFIVPDSAEKKHKDKPEEPAAES